MSKKVKSSRGLLIFGIVWTAFSSIFAVIGIKMCYDAYNRSGWPETACELTHFEILANPNNDPPFQPKAKYTYQWEGVTHAGDRVWAQREGEDDYEDLAGLIEQYRNGELTTCRVNPDSPAESVLIAAADDAWGGIVFALFGVGFMSIGAGMVYVSRLQKKKENAALSSKKKDEKTSPAILIPFFSIFALAGFGILFFVVVPQWIKYSDAKRWVETPAKVNWSRVQSHTDSDGTTYSVDIFYSYEFEGKEYNSNTLGLMSGSSSGRDSKQEKVNAHPPGKEITCYVNPDNPWQALLDRDLGWAALFALFPLPFIGVGVGGLWWMLRKRAKARRASSSKNPYIRSSALAETETETVQKTPVPVRQVFKPGGKRIGWFFGSIAIALFWNGITSVFVWQAVKSWQRGNPEWFLIIFITPFVLIGIGFILHIFYRLLALFNPTSTLTLTPGEITLGIPAKLKWNSSGSAHRFQHFTIHLVGQEEASYRRGTDTVTETETFYEKALIDTQDPRKSMTGSATIDLPPNQMNLMPSWKGGNNSIKWSIHVKGDISIWPDVSDQYDVIVRPLDIEN
ncbi:MAG: DUF3592 domain-containing protein [Akkermansiaceae bacterium]